MSDKNIKILIVDDSELIQNILYNMFNSAPDMTVVGQAKNGEEAVRLTKQLKPDLITMDICMPVMDGLEATKHIMTETPTPIVVITSHANEKELNTVFNALNVGALTVIEKPQNIFSEGFAEKQTKLLNTIRALSEIHVTRYRARVAAAKQKARITDKPHIAHLTKQPQLIALGASTGGPEALLEILKSLAKNLPVPIVIVQHIAKGFLAGLVGWLQHQTGHKVNIVSENKQSLHPGQVYFAPEDRHLSVQAGKHPLAIIEDSPPINHFRPSISHLFLSIAKSYPNQAIAGLLTDMGEDGANGLFSMKQAGCYTFIQSESSCIVFGMPGSAKALKAECKTLDLAMIAGHLTKLLNKENVND